MGKAGEDTSGLVGAVRRTGAEIVEGLGLRLELLGVELQHEKRRLFGTVLLAVCAALAGFMALLLGNLAVVIRFWEQRVLVMGLLAGGHVLLALVCVWIVRRRLAGGGTPFDATTAELRKDVEALGNKR